MYDVVSDELMMTLYNLLIEILYDDSDYDDVPSYVVLCPSYVSLM